MFLSFVSFFLSASSEVIPPGWCVQNELICTQELIKDIGATTANTEWLYGEFYFNFVQPKVQSSKSEYVLAIEMAGSGQLSAGGQWSTLTTYVSIMALWDFVWKVTRNSLIEREHFPVVACLNSPFSFAFLLLMAHYQFILYKWSMKYEITPPLATSDRKNEINDRNGIHRSVWWMMIMSIHSMVGSVAGYFLQTAKPSLYSFDM